MSHDATVDAVIGLAVAGHCHRLLVIVHRIGVGP
jgi:hypothetical protein